MKKKLIVILSIFTLLFLVSCGSKPEEESVEPEAPSEVVEELSQEEVDTLLAEVAAARKRAVDAGAETKCPNELTKIDNDFAAVKDDKVTLKEQCGKFVTLYDALVTSILEKDAETNLLSAIDAARSDVIKAGAETFTPGELKRLDDYYTSLKEDKTKFMSEGLKVPGYYEELLELVNQVKAEKELSESIKASIDAARVKVVEAGVENVLPEELGKLDAYVETVKADEALLKAEGPKVPGYYDSLITMMNDKLAEEKLIADLESAIDSARAKAVEAGAEKVAADELKQLDEYVATLKANKETLKAEGSKVPGYYDSIIALVNDRVIESELIGAIDVARAKAVKAGATKYAADELKQLDEYIATLKADKALLKAEGSKVPGYYDSIISIVNERIEEKKILDSIELARGKAIKAGAEQYVADELKQLDDYVATLKADKETLKAEGSKVPEYYSSLISIVNDKKTIENIVVNIEVARAKAIEVDAENNAPTELKIIDDYYNSVTESEDVESLKAHGHKISNCYKSLVSFIGAKDAKKIIDEENLAPYAQNIYDKALANYNSVVDSYNNITEVPQTIIKTATDARRDFRSVITVAYKKAAKAEREAAYTEKKNADKVRAAVTQKERYKSAVENFNKGDSLYSMQDAKKAAEYYKAAKEEFASLHNEVSEEMLAALAAIEAAKKNVAESSMYAEEADEVAPITNANMEGIEEEGTVLLEADDYEDPNAAIIDLADTVEEKEVTETEEPEELVADEQYIEEVVETVEEEPEAEAENKAEAEGEQVTEETTEPAEPEVSETETNATEEAVPADTETEVPAEEETVPAETETEAPATEEAVLAEPEAEVPVEEETVPAETENEIPVETETAENEVPVLEPEVVVPAEPLTEEADKAPSAEETVVTPAEVVTETPATKDDTDVSLEIYMK